METPCQHLKTMLEMTYSPRSIDQGNSETPSRDSNGVPESSHKLINKVHKLEKDVLYWQDKCLEIRLALQKLKLDKEQEARSMEEKHNALVSAMQSQRAQIVDEIEELKAHNKALQEKLVAAKENEKQLKMKAESQAVATKESVPDATKILTDPLKFIEAARFLNAQELGWLHYHLSRMMSNSMGMPHEPMPYQMPPMYPPASYYQYPMMPIYNKGPYAPYHNGTED